VLVEANERRDGSTHFWCADEFHELADAGCALSAPY
jgi:hypothetical protein